MYYYIANPISGRNRLAQIQPKLLHALHSLGVEGSWLTTTAPGEVQAAATQAVAKGFTTIVAIGGDDTFSEVLNGLVGRDNVAAGVIPIGLNNRLASRLGLTDWHEACRALATRRLTSYSLIAAGQKYFLSALELGITTSLDKHADRNATGLTGQARQLAASLNQARQFEALKYNIEVDQAYTLSGKLFSISVTNCRFANPQAKDKLVIEIYDHPQRQLAASRFKLGAIRHRHHSAADHGVSTRIFANSIVLATEPTESIMVDGRVAGRTPIAIRLTDTQARIITAKPKPGWQRAINH